MGIEIIYDVYKDGKYYGTYRGSDIRKELSMDETSFYKAVNKGRTIRGHYKLIPVDQAIGKNDRILEDFDKTATTISEQLRGRIRGRCNRK